MRSLVALLLVGGCATAAPPLPPREAVPYGLTVCPGSIAMPAPLPRVRNVEMVLAHDAAVSDALRVAERRRAICAETLLRLVEWIGENP